MYGIERANPDRLAGVFSSFDDANWTDKTKLSDERLKDLVEHMSKIRVGIMIMQQMLWVMPMSILLRSSRIYPMGSFISRSMSYRVS